MWRCAPRRARAAILRLFIDESLSPELALRLNRQDVHDAVHPLHVGRRGEPDHLVLRRCIAEDRVIVTQNADDFRRLALSVELHSGIIVLPGVNREDSWLLLLAGLKFLAQLGQPDDLMVNHLLEVSPPGFMNLYPWHG